MKIIMFLIVLLLVGCMQEKEKIPNRIALQAGKYIVILQQENDKLTVLEISKEYQSPFGKRYKPIYELKETRHYIMRPEGDSTWITIDTIYGGTK